ncbi:MAG: hypothetical protein ACREN8_07000 [Candidatus Dormibacteraceae bacterium]
MKDKKEVAKALIREAEEVEALEESGERPAGPYHRTPRPRDPSQVYTLRMPVALLGRLKEIADQQDMNPSTLMRHWVLERLEAEDLRSRNIDHLIHNAVREELKRAGLFKQPSLRYRPAH